jgi:hypothetical protein
MRGYTRHVTPSPEAQARLPDAVRFRPRVVAAHAPADAVTRGEAPPGDAWWASYGRADDVAERALTRTGPGR